MMVFTFLINILAYNMFDPLECFGAIVIVVCILSPIVLRLVGKIE